MDEHRQTHRHIVIVQRVCALGVITFKELRSSRHSGRLVNVSREGIGIESDSRIDPGFVLFRDRLCGHRAGILIWSRREGGRYRSGIRFVPLTHQEEQYLLGNPSAGDPHLPLRSPEEIMETLVQSLTRTGH
ncbi:MAG: hypothetical protein A2078_06405 [Nitrospirae bacterium GWC2_57_9]|nr:MAG: hypothetical protein A2078_06405 [Nitrospirae bacterium GWC2_57_9]